MYIMWAVARTSDSNWHPSHLRIGTHSFVLANPSFAMPRFSSVSIVVQRLRNLSSKSSKKSAIEANNEDIDGTSYYNQEPTSEGFNGLATTSSSSSTYPLSSPCTSDEAGHDLNRVRAILFTLSGFSTDSLPVRPSHTQF